MVNFIVTLVSTRLISPEDGADALKHVGVLTICKTLYICCAFVRLDNTLYTLHGTYINIIQG